MALVVARAFLQDIKAFIAQTIRDETKTILKDPSLDTYHWAKERVKITSVGLTSLTPSISAPATLPSLTSFTSSLSQRTISLTLCPPQP